MTTREFAQKLDEARQGRGLFFLDRLIGKLNSANADIPQNQVLNLYMGLKQELQFEGMRMSLGDKEYDNHLWESLTAVLTVVHDVLVGAFKMELPKPRVVSAVTEAIEAGVFVLVKGEDGEDQVAPNEADPYTLTIRITKVPFGPAPEEFRESWVGLELPARRAVQCLEIVPEHPTRDNYVVPQERALAILREKSEEAADWFEENFVDSDELLFGTDEAEIVEMVL